MAGPDLKARIGLEGEQQFRQAIKEINTDLGINASEMRKVKAQYQDNANSIEALTAKGETLEKRLESQREKVQTLQAALRHAVEAYGEGSEEALKYTKQLNDAEAQVYNTESAIRENNEALDEAKEKMEETGEATEGLGSMLDSVAGKFGVSLPDGLKKSLDGFGSFSTKSVAAVAGVAAAVVALGEAVKKMHQITLDAAKEADDLITKSMTTGVSTKTLQQWKYASNLIDVSVDTMTGSLTKLTRNMADAADGNENLSAAFNQLGVSITNQDGTLRNAEDVFYDLIDALGQVENQTERDALTMEIFGKSAQDLNPLILQGSEALKGLAADAEAAGYVLDESQIKKLGEVDDAYQKMQLQIEATKKELAVQFAPASKAAMELFTDLVSKAGKALKDTGIIEGFSAIVESLANIITGGDKLSDGTLPKMDQKFNLLRSSMGAVALLMAGIADAANLITSIVTLDWNGVKQSLGFGYRSGNANNFQRVMMQQNGTWEQYSTYYGNGSTYGFDAATNRYYDRATGNYIVGTPAGFNAGGSDNWRGGLTWVGESGPELVALPSGSRILSNQESRQLGGDVFNITIDAKSVQEFNDIVEIARSARVRRRMEG